MNAHHSAKKLSQSSSTEFSVEAVRVCDIGHELQNVWRHIRTTNPVFGSPYFAFEYLKAVDSVRKDVEVLIIKNLEKEVIGFFPFQKSRSGCVEPIGGRINDVHGLLTPPLIQLSMLDVLRKAGLSQYSFHALVNNPVDLDEFEFEKKTSYYIDLSNGYEHYERWIRNHSKTVKRQGQKYRGMVREFGEPNFVFDSVEPEALDRLVALKRQRYQRGKTFDILSVDWANNLLKKLHVANEKDFQGLLSLLWAGDDLVAGHFGMLNADILHYWFPAYDFKFHKYSPGTQLILEVAKSAAEQGITKIDFGYGDDPYKAKFCNAREEVSCGQFQFSRFAFFVAKQRFNIRNSLKKIPMKSQAKTVLRGVYPSFGQWNFK